MQINHEIDQELYKRSYHNSYTPEKEQKILQIGGKVIGTLGNICVFSGLPKAGKSTFLNACIAGAFVPYSIFEMAMFLPPGRKVVCYIDTESSEYDFYRSIGRMKSLINMQEMPSTFLGYRMRDLNPREIQAYIDYIIQLRPDCSVLVIDGLLDLLMNYNDEVESRMLINWLKKITSQANILLIGVVHTGKKDGLTLGHFGSMIDRYCQSVLSVEKDNKEQTFELKGKFLRSDIEFSPIKIMNDNGVFRQVN
jgi:hypothetical protein